MNNTENPLLQLGKLGQSFWLDFISRQFVEGGELEQLIATDGLKGLTSNPSIFEKAIAEEKVDELRGDGAANAQQVFERLAVRDIREAADLLRKVYDETGGRDGFVSLEVSPELSRNTESTLAEARHLWGVVDRPNLMIKVPGTAEGLPAVERLLAEGINVNITLLFSVDAYRETAEAYLRALEQRAKQGNDLSKIASVASFFISRIDSAVDAALKDKWKAAPPDQRGRIESLFGKIAIANAKRAYALFEKLFSGPRWNALAEKGAQPQRLLWASTSTKDPSYRDVLYVEELAGPLTVNTMPPATAKAFKDHGKVRNALVEDVAGAERQLGELEALGISLKSITDQLLVQGIELFEKPYEKMLKAIGDAIGANQQNSVDLHLPDALRSPVEAAIADWSKNNKVQKVWNKDASVWTGADEARWLGWLGIVESQQKDIAKFEALAADVKKQGFQHAVVLGMGGSSLAPEVLARTFGKQQGAPQLEILDSTNPDEIQALEARLDLKKTIFIVSSKSGSTLEPNLYYAYFRHRMNETVGAEQAGQHFIAVTDPGSSMEKVARQDGFRKIFYGLPEIGGRYSALSDFGMVPAAIAGLDVQKLLNGAARMVKACTLPSQDNPGLVLGAVMGTLGNAGRDKVTIIASPAIQDLGAWLEQLIAESTGKIGRGLIPVDREPLGPPDVYGSDRLFAYVRYTPSPDAKQDAAVDALMKAGQPVVRIDLADIADLGGEFFRWEFATAVAGSILGINPFDQPDVEASKIATRKLTEAYEKTGSLPQQAALLSDSGIQVFANDRNASVLKKGNPGSLTSLLQTFLQQIQPGDYVALLGYIQRNPAHESLLEQLRQVVRDSHRVATCGGFGPRFLHSTGQAYKGGPNSGLFVQITSEHQNDLAVPGKKYTFGIVQNAQAAGDLEVLNERGRRAIRIHLPANVEQGLATFAEALRSAAESKSRVNA